MSCAVNTLVPSLVRSIVAAIPVRDVSVGAAGAESVRDELHRTEGPRGEPNLGESGTATRRPSGPGGSSANLGIPPLSLRCVVPKRLSEASQSTRLPTTERIGRPLALVPDNAGSMSGQHVGSTSPAAVGMSEGGCHAAIALSRPARAAWRPLALGADLPLAEVECWHSWALPDGCLRLNLGEARAVRDLRGNVEPATAEGVPTLRDLLEEGAPLCLLSGRVRLLAVGGSSAGSIRGVMACCLTSILSSTDCASRAVASSFNI